MWRLSGISLLFLSASAQAGTQIYEPLSDSVKAVMQRAVSDQAASRLTFSSETEGESWLAAMSGRLAKHIPDQKERDDFLITVHYEASRSGLDPQLVLSIIQIESGFRKYAISKAGARGYMQVMPFWITEIGAKEHNLFHLRANLRYGCTILRHYLDIEKGDYFRALGRYNGSLGQADYPNLVVGAWQKTWAYLPDSQRVSGKMIGF